MFINYFDYLFLGVQPFQQDGLTRLRYIQHLRNRTNPKSRSQFFLLINIDFVKNNLFAEKWDNIDEILIDEISSYNQKGFIEIQFENRELFRDFKKEYFENGKIWNIIQNNTPYFLNGVNYECFGYVENEDENCAVIYAY